MLYDADVEMFYFIITFIAGSTCYLLHIYTKLLFTGEHVDIRPLHSV